MRQANESRALSPQARRMRGLIRDAMIELLDDGVDFSDVTIDMVAERADVHRSTVYRHFGSLEEILGDCLCEHFGRVNRNLPPIDDPGFFECAERALAESHREIMRNPVLYSYSRLERRGLTLDPAHLRLLVEQSNLFASATTRAFARKHGVEPESVDFLVTMQSITGSAIIDAWIEGGFQQSPEELARVSMEFFESLAVAAAKLPLSCSRALPLSWAGLAPVNEETANRAYRP
ncbi:MAG: TetR/AcrR family transcriptional regulator [Eggerthellaceae bacterium]|nr:TetR/AcrR family transcriptional regulator [Eggerthellaceae bacterium]